MTGLCPISGETKSKHLVMDFQGDNMLIYFIFYVKYHKSVLATAILGTI